MSLLNRKRVILAKIESVYGTDPVPTGSANAILVRNLDITPLDGQGVDLAYVRPYFGASPNIRVENFASVNFECDIAGAATAGTAPPWGPLLRGCAFAETLVAAAVTGTAQAGSTSSTLKLAAGASATDDVYLGATVTITSGTGSGQSRNIIDYVGSTKVATVDTNWTTTPDATSQYSIGPNANYNPVSGTLESCTLYFNVDGVLHKLLGARGSVSFELNANQLPGMKFNFVGMLGTITDTALPTVDYSAWQVPVAVNTANTTALLQGISSSALESFSLDMANQVKHRQLVNSESVILTDRAPKGNVSIEATTVAAKDWWTSVKDATTGVIAIQNGTVAGNVVRLDLPKGQLTEPKYADSDGIAMLQMGLIALPTVGNDDVRVTVK